MTVKKRFREILSNPEWDGIAGIVAIITFLLFILEKVVSWFRTSEISTSLDNIFSSEWSKIVILVSIAYLLFYLGVNIKNLISAEIASKIVDYSRFAFFTLVVFFFGIFISGIICVFPFVFFISFSELQNSASINISEWILGTIVVGFKVLLLMSSSPTIAAMTSREKKVSERRAIIAGVINSTLAVIYFGFIEGDLVHTYVESAQIGDNNYQILSIFLASIGIILNSISLIVLGVGFGGLAHEVVYRLRKIFDNRFPM